MLIGRVELKQSLYRKIMTVIACSLCFGSLGVYAIQVRMPSVNTYKSSPSVEPLLLNSGVVQTKKAEVNVILWFEDGKIPLGIWTNKPMSDWIWNYKELQTGSGKVAVTLSGHRQVDNIEESNLYTWYTVMARQLSETGGRIFLDERVPQIIDISAYLSQTNALPAQWALVGNLLSIAAYQNNLKTSVVAGNDRINVQLLSRGQNTEGQTVLAIPVLLEEF